MELTVAICTSGRWDLLRACLQTLAGQQAPEGVEWEVVVVNNGPDPAPAALREGLDGLALRVVTERRPGLSHARNRAVGEATGSFILWTDDDVYVDPGWIAAYAAAIRRHPDASLFGGPIRAHFETPPPRWLERTMQRIGSAFAVRDLGSEPTALAPGRLPYGANFGIRASVQRDHLYDPELGRRGAGLGLGHEETEVMTRILARGDAGFWVPDAGVRHRIGSDRLRTRYIREYFAAEGEYVYGKEGLDGRWLTLRLLARIGRARLRYHLRRPLGDPRVWVRDLVAASVARGQLRAHLRGRSPHPRDDAP